MQSSGKHYGQQHVSPEPEAFKRAASYHLSSMREKERNQGLSLARHLGMKDERRAYTLKSHLQKAMSERNNRYLLQSFVEVDEAFLDGKTPGCIF